MRRRLERRPSAHTRGTLGFWSESADSWFFLSFPAVLILRLQVWKRREPSGESPPPDSRSAWRRRVWQKRRHQLEVACSIDGVPSTIIVDTGSAATCVEKSIGIKAGIIMKHTRRVLIGSGGANTPLRIGRVKQLAIGNFEIKDANISFIDLKKAEHSPAHLLGIGELVSNSAIIDVGGLSMYLRHH